MRMRASVAAGPIPPGSEVRWGVRRSEPESSWNDGDAVAQSCGVATMIDIRPLALEGHGIRLEPLAEEHRDGLAAAVADGRLWELRFTAVPEPDQMHAYIAEALAGQADGAMLPWA